MSHNDRESYRENKELQIENDGLREDVFLQKYIIDNYGKKTWNQILGYIPNNEEENGGNSNA